MNLSRTLYVSLILHIIMQQVQARVTVVDDAIKDFMLNNPQEGISITLTNPQKQVVLE